jgi:hypothetical protein
VVVLEVEIAEEVEIVGEVEIVEVEEGTDPN